MLFPTPRWNFLCLGILLSVLPIYASAAASHQTILGDTAATSDEFDGHRIVTRLEDHPYRIHGSENNDSHYALNPSQNLAIRFDTLGFEVRSQGAEDPRHWGLELERYGYGDRLLPAVEGTVVRAGETRIEVRRGPGLIEWYVNDHRGLEHGFTLNRKPMDSTGLEPLRLYLCTRGDLIPEVAPGGRGVLWKTEPGSPVFHYGGLYANDAGGKRLFARIETTQNGIAIAVNDSGALYPITIDPVVQQTKLFAADPGEYDHFGWSVAIDRDTAIVGSYQDNVSWANAGSAYVFYRNQGGTDNWGQVKKLTVGDGTFSDYFGWSVSISGDTAIIGAYNNDEEGINSGAAYIFSRHEGGNDNWGLVKKLTASDGKAGDWFGYSVDVHGGHAVVGAIYGHDDDVREGAVYAFSAASGWNEVKKLVAGDGENGDGFGWSVAIDTKWAVVGAPSGDSVQISGAGAAYLFSVSGWGKVKKLTASDGETGDGFGGSVDISAKTLIVGAPYDHGLFNDSIEVEDAGAAYIFHADNNWQQARKLISGEDKAFLYFGSSVAVGGGKAVVGAVGDRADRDFFDAGAVYVFSRNETTPGNWGRIARFYPPDVSALDDFGSSVAISNAIPIVGSPDDNYLQETEETVDGTGSAYVLDLQLTEADIELEKLVDRPPPYHVGQTIEFFLSAENRGPSDATAVKVSDLLPDGLEYVSDDGSGGYDSDTGLWDVGDLANREVASLHITARVRGVGDIVNRMTKTDSVPADPDPDNDVSEVALSASHRRGDVNGDGKVDLVDAILSARIVCGLNPAITLFVAGDVDGDGLVGLGEFIYASQEAGGLR